MPSCSTCMVSCFLFRFLMYLHFILVAEIKYGSRFIFFQVATQLCHLLKCWLFAPVVWAVLLYDAVLGSVLDCLVYSTSQYVHVLRPHGFIYGGFTQLLNTGGGLLTVAFLPVSSSSFAFLFPWELRLNIFINLSNL